MRDKSSFFGVEEEKKEIIDQQNDGKNNAVDAIKKMITDKLKLVGIGVGIVMVILSIAGFIAYRSYFAPVDKGNDEEIEVVIPRGSSLSSIARLLEENDVIRSNTVFKYYVDFTDRSSSLQAGTYSLNRTMSFEDIIDELRRGDGGYAVIRYTIAEGLTLEGMAEVLVKNNVIDTTEEFLSACSNAALFEEYDFIKQAAAEENADKKHYLLEGYVFPDTYEVYANSSVESIIKKHLNRFDEIFTDAYKKRAEELNMTVDDVLTLASMIEREAKQKDFAKVSAVFHLRLKKGMTLGSDVTLQYIFKTNKYVFSSAETKTDSLYNTYVNKGLPVGPICNPSKRAIEAALYPDEDFMKQEYLYFCLKEPNSGELAFAKTLSEHNKNVNKYNKLWLEEDKKNGV